MPFLINILPLLKTKTDMIEDMQTPQGNLSSELNLLCGNALLNVQLHKHCILNCVWSTDF